MSPLEIGAVPERYQRFNQLIIFLDGLEVREAAEITHFVQPFLFLASRLGFLKLAYHSHYYTATAGNQSEYSLSITRSVVQRKNVN